MRRVVWGGDGGVRPVWVVLLFTVVCVVASLETTALLPVRATSLSRPEALVMAAPTVAAAAAGTAVGLLFRQHTGLVTRRPLREAAAGAAMALGLITLAVAGPWASGALTLRWAGLSVAGFGGVMTWAALVLGPAALAEELIVRGAGFWALARATTPALAVVVTGGLFGALHLGNPGASPVAAACIALVGLWLGLLVVRTRGLWASTAAHATWNIGEGFIFGRPVSGLSPGRSLFQGQERGGDWFFSGGDFGPEAAPWTALLLVGAVVATWLLPSRLTAAAWKVSDAPG